MPEDEAGLRVLDGRARGKVLEDDVVQRGGDVQQVIRSSGDVEHLDHARQVRGQGDEGLDLVAVMCLHADGNDGLYRQTDRGQVDVGVIPVNDATFVKGTDPPKTG